MVLANFGAFGETLKYITEQLVELSVSALCIKPGRAQFCLPGILHGIARRSDIIEWRKMEWL